MADLQLFDPGVPVEPPRRLSADARRTQTQRESLARGVHPATGRKLLDPARGLTCSDCAHCVHVSSGRRVYVKCERHRLGTSHSAASDLRVSWPACVLYRLDHQEPAHD